MRVWIQNGKEIKCQLSFTALTAAGDCCLVSTAAVVVAVTSFLDSGAASACSRYHDLNHLIRGLNSQVIILYLVCSYLFALLLGRGGFGGVTADGEGVQVAARGNLRIEIETID